MSYFRNMKTTAERREVAPSTEQGVKVRASRNLANLPTAWDDRPRARRARPDRYKNHR